jgi:hypothetical protein
LPGACGSEVGAGKAAQQTGKPIEIRNIMGGFDEFHRKYNPDGTSLLSG